MSTLSIAHVSVSVGEQTLLSDISLEIASGELHMLMGPNGSGKSSLLNALMGHPRYQVHGGTMQLEGEDVLELPTHEKARKGILLSMQHLPEIPGVTLTNFLHRAAKELHGDTRGPLEFYRAAVAKAEAVGIDPSFLKKHVNSGLSGGEKKQSELLQLLLLQPKFVLLDEIDSGVDVDAMKKVYAGVAELRKEGVGVLLVTHHPKILEHVEPDHVHVLREGRLIASGGRELAQVIMQNGFQSLPTT